jgi:DNA-directed RNA polymerase subunit beta
LRAIFGEKAADVKDASLVCPPGIDGTVVDVQVFTRKGQEKDQRSLSIEQDEEERLRRDLEDEIRILQEQRNERIYELFEGRKLSADLTVNREVVIAKGVPITREMLEAVEPKACAKPKSPVPASMPRLKLRLTRIAPSGKSKFSRTFTKRRLPRLRQGDELSPGVIKMVQGLHRHEAQAFGWRQDGRPPR